ncbi:Ankyrin-2 [Orbilia brochopaga]|nr:Ankyrin-2 [Drechslerella brochopaga]
MNDLDFIQIWYHVWIQRRLGASCSHLKTGDLIYNDYERYCAVTTHLFGNLESLTPDDIDGHQRPPVSALRVKTRNETIEMCAQDIFIFLLLAALQKIPSIGGKTETREHTGSNWTELALQNSTVEAMADRFETSGLGSREDAYMCIFPVLRHLDKMPKMDDVVSAVVEKANLFKNAGKWTEAMNLLSWLHRNPGVVDNRFAARALSDLYYTAIWEKEKDVSHLGFAGLCRMLETKTDDLDFDIIKEYAWIALRVAEDRGLGDCKSMLLVSGADEKLVPEYIEDLKPVDWAEKNMTIVLKYLIQKKDEKMELNAQDKNGLTALCWALKHKNIDMANLLLQEDVDTGIMDNDGRTALLYAAESGLHVLLRDLLERRQTNINCREKSTGKTALMMAAENGHTRCVELLLEEKYIAIEERDNDGNCASHLAAGNGHFQVLDLLLARGANLGAKGHNNETILHRAVTTGNIRLVEMLLNHGHTINDTDSTHQTALDIAAGRGFEEIVAMLLENGALFFQRSGTKRPVFTIATAAAAKHNHLKILQMLIDAQEKHLYNAEHQDERDFSKAAALREAIQGEHEEVIKYLIQVGADICLPDKYAGTPVFWAIRTGNEKIVNLLLQTAHDPPSTERHWPPLTLAIERGYEAMVKLLVERRTNYVEYYNYGRDPWDTAAEKGNISIIRLLLKTGGINLEKTNGDGFTPLTGAISKGQESVVRALIEAGADVNFTPVGGRTPLLEACAKGYHGIAQLLLENGARESINRPEASTGRTPLATAIYHEHHSIANLLRKAGAEDNTVSSDE